MGLDSDGRPAGTASRAGGRPATKPKPAAAEAVAAISLEEAYHGTTRLVEVDGKRLEVSIPKGADTGTRIRLTGKAPGGGDLYVVVRQDRDRVFTRRGADLERELPLTLREALLGADVHVRTPKGRVLLTIPAGTQSGRTFRLTGQGMPRFRAEGFGDLYVKARVVLPSDLSPEAREAAERFLDLAQQPDPRARET
jgi:curved DNA-binding protein